MEILLLTGVRAGEPASVLPALDLLPHSVRTAPRDVRTLVSGPSPDVVLVDARSELADARATCRMLHATGLGVPLLAVVSESGLVALDECSIVTAPYEADGEVVGTVGVIGPTRMAYERVIPIVEITARLLSSAMSQRARALE